MAAAIRFLTNEAGKVEGLAYAGFETFRGSPYTSCAQETGQNSRDAASGEGPVQVSFRLLEIPREEIPFADQLQHSIQCCLDEPTDADTKHHLRRALTAINAPTVKVLEISDRNTTGLTGPVGDPTSVFTALVKGDGVTNKADVTSAGSYGIGKNAAYAVSYLQTVIYSTCYQERSTRKRKFAAQGRLRLISHKEGSKKFSAEGYWGNPDFAAIEDEAAVPSWMQRTEIGTSIYSVGFREQHHWAARMALSLVANFFLAIDRKQIEFTVDDAFRMNESSLDSVLDSPQLREIAAESDQLEQLERARRLLDCTRSEAATRHTLNVPGLGDFTLHLLVAEKLPREVHILRNGIYICDNFAKFSEPMRIFRGTREFTAVLEPSRTEAGRKPSELLKRLENPAHDAFEPERIVEARSLEQARTQIRYLIKQVRNVIKATAKIEETNHSQLDELSHLFADCAPIGGNGQNNKEKDPERFQYGVARKATRGRPSGTVGEGIGKRRFGNDTNETTPRSKNAGGGSERTPPGTQSAIALEAIRSFLPEPTDGRKRTVYFTPGADGDIEISVAAAGLSGDVGLSVVGTSRGVAQQGRVRTTVTTGQRVVLQLALAEPYGGPIEVSARTSSSNA